MNFLKIKKEHRHEDVLVKIVLPCDTPSKYRKMAEKVVRSSNCSNLCLSSDDYLTLTYNFNIDYYNGIEERLNLILKLAEAGFIEDASLEELNYHNCLINDFLLKINEIMKSHDFDDRR